MNKRNKILLGLGIVIALMQLIRIDTNNPEVIPEKDFIAHTQANEKLTNILKSACYDCHSNATTYPWYSQIAPASWWLKDHINEGRDELNFSIWTDYSAKKANHKLEECIELIKENEMPLASYTWLHPQAKLNQEQRVALVNFFQKQRQ